MTAVRYDDLVPAPIAPATPQKPRPRPGASANSGNPLTDMTAQLLSVPLRQLYAALWRMGVIEVTS
ncbi:Rv1535 family protein [Mycobacterium sp. E2479]|uniref:Rv1535 family protein n=1 Tax=Mycobacterium sp. E2479 TaxID=1834134 RepID=UPI0007FC0F6C|nr:Rv1535 family protein [Mycobacterium sp. E2479]OBH59803.1 hypothetical protein A5686_22520 [Mycobacterium sp. E2479]